MYMNAHIMSVSHCAIFLVLCSGIVANSYDDYKEVLKDSLLFYQAQRSGKLPPDQKVIWRKDSALSDRGECGEDLTGGYYDGGGYVKYGFPMAYTATLLAWSVYAYPQGYEAAGALEDGRTAVRWATDYFLKCHISRDTFYGQVGKTDLDNQYWGRPEDMTMERPAYKIDPDNPGSDLIGETVAALAAGYLMFQDVDSEYADILLTHAIQLFDLANEYRGNYVDSIPDAKNPYNSSGYEDELVWAATWIFRATLNESYLEQAEEMYDSFRLQDKDGFDWDTKNSGIDFLLAAFTDSPKYLDKLRNYSNYIVHNHTRTPGGLTYFGKPGSLAHAAEASFICLQAAMLGMNSDICWDFAEQQIGYMLGNTGSSFVVGFGDNYPTHVRHESSSCPDTPESCGWDNFYSNASNPHILYGALVGGPDQDDNFTDNRQELSETDVRCYYNAAFQTVTAALLQHYTQMTSTIRYI